jgi:hypothetical protein
VVAAKSRLSRTDPPVTANTARVVQVPVGRRYSAMSAGGVAAGSGSVQGRAV